MSDFVSDHRDIIYGETLEDKIHRMLKSTPWWLISFVIHAVLLFVVSQIALPVPLPEEEMEMQSDLIKEFKMPPVVLPETKPEDQQQEVKDNTRTQVNRPDVNQNQLNKLNLKTPGDPDQDLRVLAVPGGVARVGAIGGGGFEVSGGLKEAIGAVIGWPGWRNRCLAVWLFDESKSMKDDQQLVRQKVDQLYEELGINMSDSRAGRRIVTAVCSYGKDLHIILGKPTNDMTEIKTAIEKIPVDTTGKENYLAAINGVLNKFSGFAKRYGRNIVIVLVTDEGGDDDVTAKGSAKSNLEGTLARMKKMKASLLVFGTEAGEFAYGSEQTYDPTVKAGYSPYAWVNRGISTAFAEMFPHDWYFRRTQRVPSGFGPYGTSRLCRETGGVFYLMRTAKANAYDYEKLLKGYQPELASRGEIAKRNRHNRLRRVLMGTIISWKKIRGEPGDRRFSSYFAKSEAGKRRMQATMKVVNEWIALMNSAIKDIEKLSNVAVKNSPKRWEANHDLTWAMVHKLRFQLVQYKLALTDLMRGRNLPPPGDIGWHISWHRNPIIRTADAVKLAEEKARILKMFEKVIEKHADTPWEAFAKREMRQMRGFAVHPYSRSKSRGIKHEAR